MTERAVNRVRVNILVIGHTRVDGGKRAHRVFLCRVLKAAQQAWQGPLQHGARLLLLEELRQESLTA